MARYSKINSFNALKTLTVGSKSYQIYSLPRAAQSLGNIDQLPKSLKVLLENLLRFEDQKSVKVEHIQALVDWQKHFVLKYILTRKILKFLFRLLVY